MDTTRKFVEHARDLAYIYHNGQTDLAGKPYTEHLEAVASGAETDLQKTVAYLHDILEDTDCSIDTLTLLFPFEVVEAVRTMTRPEGDHDYFEYIRRIKQNPLARSVKMSDLRNNSDLSRLSNPGPEDLKRTEKYKKALAILTED